MITKTDFHFAVESTHLIKSSIRNDSRAAPIPVPDNIIISASSRRFWKYLPTITLAVVTVIPVPVEKKYT